MLDHNPSDPLRFALFAGFAHSGHSLVGAIIDAHPSTMIANELNTLSHLNKCPSTTRVELLNRIIESAKKNSSAEGWTNTGYTYQVPHSHQGAFTKLELVGDKRGGGASRAYRDSARGFDLLRGWFDGRLSVITVVRHPLDIIAAAAFRRKRAVDSALVQDFADQLAATTKMIQALDTDARILVRHDELVANPKLEIHSLFGRLGLANDDAFATNATRIVRQLPPRRASIVWKSILLSEVKEQVARNDAMNIFGSYELNDQHVSTESRG